MGIGSTTGGSLLAYSIYAASSETMAAGTAMTAGSIVGMAFGVGFVLIGIGVVVYKTTWSVEKRI